MGCQHKQELENTAKLLISCERKQTNKDILFFDKKIIPINFFINKEQLPKSLNLALWFWQLYKLDCFNTENFFELLLQSQRLDLKMRLRLFW